MQTLEQEMLTFKGFITESKFGHKISAPGYNSHNHYVIKHGPTHFEQGIKDAYDASNVASHMLRKTIEGKTKVMVVSALSAAVN